MYEIATNAANAASEVLRQQALEQGETDEEDSVDPRRSGMAGEFNRENRNLRAFVSELRHFWGVRNGLGELLNVSYLHSLP
jgi:hypothetical protein